MTTAFALLRRFWWAVPMIGLAVALLVTRATLADRTATLTQERTAWTLALAEADMAKAKAEAANAARLADAAGTYATQLAAREPIILHSTNTVREYAQTDAGRARCLSADRVLGIDALDRDLAEAARPASRGAGAVPPDSDPAPAGRVSQQR